jgi:hypothetical protein
LAPKPLGKRVRITKVEPFSLRWGDDELGRFFEDLGLRVVRVRFEFDGAEGEVLVPPDVGEGKVRRQIRDHIEEKLRPKLTPAELFERLKKLEGKELEI